MQTSDSGIREGVITGSAANPTGPGQPLAGFTEVCCIDRRTRRFAALRDALERRRLDRDKWSAGCLPDGRWAVVARGLGEREFAVEVASGTPWYRPGPLSPIEPLPETQAREVRQRLWSGLTIDDVFPSDSFPGNTRGVPS